VTSLEADTGYRPPLAAPIPTHHIIGVVLGYLREGGWSPSSGEERLIEAAFQLDPETAAACLSCPGLLEVVAAYRSGGRAALDEMDTVA
jgi:hypothetical protein